VFPERLQKPPKASRLFSDSLLYLSFHCECDLSLLCLKLFKMKSEPLSVTLWDPACICSLTLSSLLSVLQTY
jgi:hypothetical protein